MSKADPNSLSLGKHVVVIGAGNTAMDAARMSKRIRGVEDVTVVYRRTDSSLAAGWFWVRWMQAAESVW